MVEYGVDPEEKKGMGGETVVEWWIDISVTGGGVVLAEKTDFSKPSSFVAPEGGYQPTIRFTENTGMRNGRYHRTLKPELFVLFPDGTYARLETRFTHDIKRPFAVVRSWFNPSGSRNTEFDPSLEIEVAAEQ